MKLTKIIFIASCAAVLGLTSCASNSSVSRVSKDTIADVNEYWNDSDIDIVCNDLIQKCVQSPRLANFKAENGRTAKVILGPVRNDSSEFIDTSIVSLKMQNAIINSGVVDFVSSGGERDALRAERLQQIDNVDPATAAAIANETGADYMFVGRVQSVVQYDNKGKTGTRRYYVTLQMHDLSTTVIVWSGQNDEIKKIVTRPSTKL